MAVGRGSAALLVAALAAVLALHCCALGAYAATYTVGGSQGWTIGPNYTEWAAPYRFAVGDILFFPYSAGQHDVVEVNKAGYDGCSSSNALATYTNGNTNVTLNSTGTFYFICSFTGHCAAGMKLAVVVSSSASAPVPSASTPSPPTTPSAPTPTSQAPPPSGGAGSSSAPHGPSSSAAHLGTLVLLLAGALLAI